MADMRALSVVLLFLLGTLFSAFVAAQGAFPSRSVTFVLPTSPGGPTDYPGWLGVSAPGKTPPAIVNRLNAEINRAVTAPQIVRAMEPDGVIAIASTPEALAKVVATGVVRWKKVVKDNDIKAEE